MVANLAVGMGWAAFITLLIPPYVTEVTGNAADAGIGLAAVLGPVLGGLADKYRAHRLVLTLGVLGMGIGFVAYALSTEAQGVYALALGSFLGGLLAVSWLIHSVSTP